MASLKRRQADPADQLRAAVSMADAERADAVRQLQDLTERRPAILADAEDDQLRQHDEDVAKARRRIEQAEARHARLSAEIVTVEHETEQAARREAHTAGVAAMLQATTLMTTEYPKLAQAVADLLKHVAGLRAVARAANETPPDGVEPIGLHVEPFNGRLWPTGDSQEVEEMRLVHRETGEPAPPDFISGPMWERRLVKIRRPVPALPAFAHCAIADFVNLPGLQRDQYIYAAPFWGQPRV